MSKRLAVLVAVLGILATACGGGAGGGTAASSATQAAASPTKRPCCTKLTAAYSNVFYEIGNELIGSDVNWNTAVFNYIKTLTTRPVTQVGGTAVGSINVRFFGTSALIPGPCLPPVLS